MTRSRTKTSASPLNDRDEHTSSSNVASMVATIMSDLGGLFSSMDWAEDEIERATRRHPDQADALYHAFSLVQPRDIGTGMGTEFVYRAHVRELLERIAAGADTRIPTAAEICLVCAQVSLRVPLHGAAAGLYFRMWLQAFPDRPITPDQVAEQVHYERLHGTQIDEYETMLRRKAADPDRLPADIDCAGQHHGKHVTCRYATSLESARRTGRSRQPDRGSTTTRPADVGATASSRRAGTTPPARRSPTPQRSDRLRGCSYHHAPPTHTSPSERQPRMFNQLDPAVVRHCVFIGQQETLTLIDDRTAKQIADAYTWSWVTCWFAGEGEIGHEIMGEAFYLDPAGRLMHALFGWWHRSADTPDGTEYEPDEVHVITAMQNYLLDRARRDALGPVQGWREL